MVDLITIFPVGLHGPAMVADEPHAAHVVSFISDVEDSSGFITEAENVSAGDSIGGAVPDSAPLD